ncbi:GvpL/GvpF family gas vesicle protein [Patescibacteria group bacterium]|nr:GvpL/GvpF family gas vesicle protein [Patescibacteria group bacterium]
MTEERKYIYSIIRNPQPFDSTQGDSFRLPESMLGINNRDIILIPYRDIAGAVSNTHFINFDKLDKKELTKLIAAHDQVNSSLMKKHDVIPMRFGMVAENTEEIRHILAKAYIQFKTALEKIAGKAEFVVQVFWNEKNILEKIVKENPEIQKLKKETESKGKILGFASKMKLGRAIFEALESCRKEYTADILRHLASFFPDFSASKLLDKEMIMNYSFLINKTEESALELQLNKLAEKYKDALKFKYIGPMAPYSFAVINLSVGNFDLVDNARKTLGLGESAALPELKDTYHKLAAEHHPDKHEYKKDQVILEEAARKMKDIITANGVLTVYCKHYLSSLAPEEEQVCSFKREDVEESIIVKKS